MLELHLGGHSHEYGLNHEDLGARRCIRSVEVYTANGGGRLHRDDELPSMI
jgi:hypothetical protein